jgi:hypothetical protein
MNGNYIGRRSVGVKVLDWRCSSMVEHLPRMLLGSLGLIHSTTKKKKKRKKGSQIAFIYDLSYLTYFSVLPFLMCEMGIIVSAL